MLTTSFEISFSGAGAATAAIDSNASGETAAQAELVAFAHYAARMILLLGPARAGALVQFLAALGTDSRLEPAVASDAGTLRALARFIDSASGPRMYFRLKSSGSPDAAFSVGALLDSLLKRRVDEGQTERLVQVASLIAQVGATGQVRRDNEFDVALAAADVAWRRTSDGRSPSLLFAARCPACGNDDAGAGFELRVWPSETAAIRRCLGCGAGLWLREGHRPRRLREDVWSAMESIRAELTTADRPEAAGDGNVQPVVEELKRAFAEHGWPYSEVRGAPVLLSELSGPAGRWSLYAQVVEEMDLILLYSICPRRIPEDRRGEVALFLARANYGLAAGNFELDLDDGEVRYKTVLQLRGGELDALTLKRLVRANGIAMERYLPGIEAVVAGAAGRLVDLAE